jgi:hypothetical protein
LGLFGLGPKVIAEPTVHDYEAEIRLKVLRIIADSPINQLIDEQSGTDEGFRLSVRASKAADYLERRLKSNGYYGPVDFAELARIDKEMEEDVWLNDEIKQ